MTETRADLLPRLQSADREFLAAIRAFVDRHWRGGRALVAADARAHWARGPDATAIAAWFDALVERGWSVPDWPVAQGGTGWSALQRYLWNRELALAEAPSMDPVGVRWAGPALFGWGTAAQQATFLPGIRAARERWCLGFAEPETGSDLSRAQTRALTATGATAGYRVDGQKTWVNGAARARWMLTLARTGADAARPETAFSLLIIDLRGPGVSVEPVRMLDGSTGVSRVRLEEVEVPVARRLGAEGAGWDLVQALTARVSRHDEPAATLRMLADRLEAVAAELPGDQGALAEDPGFSRKLAELGVDLAGLEALEVRVVLGRDRSADRGPEAAAAGALADALKLRRTGISQRIGELFVEAFGYYSLPYPDPLTIDNEGPIGHDYALAALQGMLAGRWLSIDGDTSEGLRDRIAHQLSGY